ncbi:COR domain-containing protein [Shewanella oncorhynchi]|uniref:COR domain-containing protein n=1 Tax=Shewanella oncorhynchi TaxID=2726434 RepID=UPI003D795576
MFDTIEPNELVHIKNIEKACGFKLTQKQTIENNVGYCVTDGKITKLSLLRKRIKDLNLIFKLTFLEYLDLSYTNINYLPEEIGELTGLKVLRINGNYLDNLPKGIENLSLLKELLVSDNKLKSLPKEIFSLKELTLLGVGKNKIEILPKEISKLKELNKLWLADNILTEIPDELTDLSNLRKLDLSNNLIFSLPLKIGKLSKLKFINVSNNNLQEIPDSITNIQTLENLILNNNDIDYLPRSLENLSSISHLNVSGNNIKILPDSITKLISLKDLRANGNRIRLIPKNIGELRELKSIHLAGNYISEIPDSIALLQELKVIFLDGNDISEINSHIAKLHNLVSLSLSNNNIKIIPTFISELKAIEHLFLNENLITEVPSWITKLKKPLIWKSNRSDPGSNDGINLYGNPIETPPIEIMSEGHAAVVNYFESFTNQRPEEIVRLYEGKLLIVGEGDVGKTYLTNRLIYEKIPSGETTRGIDIHEWVINTKNIKNFRVNLWDFAGQAICHATHQFFLTSRSLYLFIWEARSDQDIVNFDYWLNIIKLLSNGSPVLVVMNKSDVRFKSIDQAAIQKEFPNVIGFHDISAKTGAGVAELRERIYAQMEALPMIGKKLIKKWVDIRKKLESMQESNYISYVDYVNICKNYSLTKDQADNLARYYHDLGVILHFNENKILDKIVILNPEWATDAVYTVVDNNKIQEENGVLNFHQLETIWCDYEPSTHIFLIELMKKFEICFELKNNKDFIIPELLHPTRLNFKWDYFNNICFVYKYSFMPAGIITRFTVRQHEIIYNSIYWRNGVCIEWDNARALVVSDPFSKTISININGENKKELLAIIRKDIQSIHQSLNNPKHDEMIPCICDDCKKDSSGSFHLYSKIQKLQNNRKRTIQCDSGNDIKISDLLGEYGINENNSEGTSVYNVNNGIIISDNSRTDYNNITTHGDHSGIDNTIGDYNTKNTNENLAINEPPAKPWYEKLALFITIISGLIAVYIFLKPSQSNDNIENKPQSEITTKENSVSKSEKPSNENSESLIQREMHSKSESSSKVQSATISKYDSESNMQPVTSSKNDMESDVQPGTSTKIEEEKNAKPETSTNNDKES